MCHFLSKLIETDNMCHPSLRYTFLVTFHFPSTTELRLSTLPSSPLTAHSISITVAEENLSSLHLFPSPLKVFWNHCLSLAFYCFPSALNLAISTSPLVHPIRLRSLASTSDFPLPHQRLTTSPSPPLPLKLILPASQGHPTTSF